VCGSLVRWWPWLSIWDDCLFLQFFILSTLFYIFFYRNIYYNLLYLFLNFFAVGVYLAVFQVELFTAFLWLVECSVIFVMLLLFFFLNIKGNYSYVQNNNFTTIFILLLFFYFAAINQSFTPQNNLNIDFLGTFDNFYEAVYNPVMNDLFGFSISYYLLNSVEFIIVGLLLLFGSVVCVNLHQVNKNVRSQSNYNSSLAFNFFLDFTSFLFLRRQNLVKQGNTKASLKIFKKK
jgi:hypothetical protein